MGEMTPQEVLRKAHERMSPDNWESDGWGGGDKGCLMYQLALAAGEQHRGYGTYSQGPIGKATSFMRRAIKRIAPEWYDLYGKNKHRTQVIAAFNDSSQTTYEDASMVLKEAWVLAEEEGIK